MIRLTLFFVGLLFRFLPSSTMERTFWPWCACPDGVRGMFINDDGNLSGGVREGTNRDV